MPAPRPRRRFTLGSVLAATVACGLLAGSGPALADTAAPTGLPGDTTEAIVVDAPSAGSTSASLSAWQRDGSSWRRVLGPVTAHLGRDGIGAPSESSSRTPAGTFGLTRAFGRNPDPGSGLPFRHVGPDDWWVSDPASPLYNTHQTCAPGSCPFDEQRSENLDAVGHPYDDAVVIDANTNPTVRGAGSAYFLHVGDGPTAGCVATAAPTVVALLRWLSPGAHPRIQLRVAGS